MKSMVKILVTIMALSLAEAPVFAAWPAQGMKVTQKVAHLKVSYPGAIDQINALPKKPAHNALNALEAELSGAAVVQAPVDMAMVVGGGAGLELGGVLALADEVVGGGADGGPVEDGGGGADGGAVGVPAVVGGGQAPKKRMCLPVLGGSGAPWVELSTERDLGLMTSRVFTTFELRKSTARTVASIKSATDKDGTKVSGYKPKKEKADHALADHRQAAAQLAFAIKQNSLFEYFAPIADALSALTARGADLTVAEIDGFIVMIEGVIGAVRQEDGTMSSGTTAVLRALMPPYAQYASNLEAYVRELRTAQAGSYAQRVRQILFSSGALIAAATLAGVFGGLQAGIVLTDVIILDMGVIPFGSIPCTQLFMAGTSALGGAAVAGSTVARFVSGGAAVDKDSSSAGAKRKHDDSNV